MSDHSLKMKAAALIEEALEILDTTKESVAAAYLSMAHQLLLERIQAAERLNENFGNKIIPAQEIIQEINYSALHPSAAR